MQDLEKDNYKNHAFSEVKSLDKEDTVRLMRLILEALEVALHLCNTFVIMFGPNRLMDIIEQLLPTAYIVNTAYWPFYQTETGDSICVCNIYHIRCTHKPGTLSWIALDRPVSDSINFKEENGNITLTDLHLSISRETIKTLSINSPRGANHKYSKIYEIMLKFKTKKIWIDTANPYEKEFFKCNLRFELVKPKMDFNTFSLWFTPHPLLNPLYGKHFPCLLDNVESNVCSKSLVVSWNNCPKYTIRIVGKKFSVHYNKLLDAEAVGLDEHFKSQTTKNEICRLS